MSGNHEIRDNSPDPVATPAQGVDRLVISAAPEARFDERAFMARVAAMQGRDRIKSVSVKPSSNLASCEILKYFENVIGMTLAGKNLVSLEGVRGSRRLRNLNVGTGKHNKIDLAELAGSSVESLRIDRPRQADLQAIGQCASIRSLDVVNSGPVDLRLFGAMQLDELALNHIKNEGIGSLDSIARIEKLTLTDCTSLARFVAPTARLRTLGIEACNRLAFESLGLLRGLKILRVAACKQPFDLEVLTSLPELEEVTFANCNLRWAGIENVRAPKLRKFWANPLKNDVVSVISRAFRSAMVCNGDVLEINGVPQPKAQVFHDP